MFQGHPMIARRSERGETEVQKWLFYKLTQPNKKHYRIDGPSVCQLISTELFHISMIVAIRLANEVKSHWNKRRFGDQRWIYLAGWIYAAMLLHTHQQAATP
jgi:hypothetical protein